MASDRSISEALISSFVLQLTLVFSGVVAARILGPVDRGNLALIWTIALILVQLAMLGLPLAITYEMASKGWSFASVWHALRVRLVAGTVVATLTQAIAIFLVFRHDRSALSAGLLSIPVIPAILANAIGVAGLQGNRSFRLMNLSRLLPFFGYSIALAGGLALGARSLPFVVLAWLLSYALGGLLAFWLALRSSPPTVPPPDGQPDPSAMTRFGLRGFLGAVSPTEVFRADQLLVGLILNPFSLGLYVAALALTNLPRFLALSVGLIAYPRIAALQDVALARARIWRYTAIAFLGTLVIVIPLAAASSTILSLFFGEPFTPAAPTVQLLLAGSPFLAARRVLSDGLRGSNHPEAGTKAEVIGWVVLVPTLFAGASLWGIEGVALALSFSYLISCCAIMGIAWRLGLGPQVVRVARSSRTAPD